MSRSKKKTKIGWFTNAKSEKEDKQKANRKFRRIIRQIVKSKKADFPIKREISNIWCFDKDGKRYFSEMKDKEMRK